MIRTRIAALALCLSAATPALAEPPIAPERIVDAVTGDWNKDGLQDLAMLVGPDDSGDMISIYVYIRQADHSLLKLVTVAKDKIWGSVAPEGMFGQEPSIAALPNGSISVKSQNSGVGRDHWEQTLTLAYRNTDFIVAGYTYSHYDTLDPENNGSCDYNVLTGSAKKDDKPVKVGPKFVPIQDWDEEKDRGPCEVN